MIAGNEKQQHEKKSKLHSFYCKVNRIDELFFLKSHALIFTEELS